MLTIALTYLTVGFLIGLVLYQQVVLSPKAAIPNIPSESPSVSIVICFHDELPNLQKQLPRLLAQNHSQFEIIYVDDGSTDGGADWLAEQSSPELIVVQSLEHLGKKRGLALGIQKAQYDRLLLTDADCIPASNEWLQIMTSRSAADIVLGYSPTYKRRGLVHLISRYETWYIGVQYMAAAQHGRAYSGVGRNLAYTRSVYERYYPSDDLLSGDDDLLIASASRHKCNIETITNPMAWTWTTGPSSWATYYRQKRRQSMTSFQYGFHQKIIIGLHAMLLLGFYGCWFATLLTGSWMMALACILAKASSCLVLSHRWSMIRTDRSLLWWSILCEMFLAVFYACVALGLMIVPVRRWK